MVEDVSRWVVQAQGGDQEAFGELVRLYQARVYSLAFGMVGNAEDAQELTQQTWIRVWQKLGSFRQDARFFTWVYRIASNLCLDFLRRRARVREEPLDETREPEPAPGEEPGTPPQPDDELQRREVREQVERAMAGLSPEHRLVLTLREMDGLAYEEIADVMKCRVGTVMSRLFYARRRLVEELRKQP